MNVRATALRCSAWNLCPTHQSFSSDRHVVVINCSETQSKEKGKKDRRRHTTDHTHTQKKKLPLNSGPHRRQWLQSSLREKSKLNGECNPESEPVTTRDGERERELRTEARTTRSSRCTAPGPSGLTHPVTGRSQCSLPAYISIIQSSPAARRRPAVVEHKAGKKEHIMKGREGKAAMTAARTEHHPSDP